MKLKIRSLHMENFKGIKSLDVNFSNKTSIKGQNAAGKTTIFDAFTWLLFNKNSAGEEKFNVRPLDKDGNRIDNVEIKVVGVIDVDGKEVELSKVQKQNWVKKRGTDTVALQGNVNSFEIDGYPKSEADFKEYISSLAQSEDMFKMLANPQYFSSMKWKEQRDILMRLVTDVSDVELAQTDAKYAQLLGELEKAPSTDDIRAKFQKALTEWKKKQSEIPVRIDEAEKSKVDVDVAEQELAKVDLVRRIAECDKKMENAGSTLGDLRSKEMQLQFDMSGIMQVMNDELSANVEVLTVPRMMQHESSMTYIIRFSLRKIRSRQMRRQFPIQMQSGKILVLNTMQNFPRHLMKCHISLTNPSGNLMNLQRFVPYVVRSCRRIRLSLLRLILSRKRQMPRHVPPSS